MMDEYAFSPSEVTLENLRELSARAGLGSEARLYELFDVADEAAEYSVALLESDVDVPELLSMLAEGLRDKFCSPERIAGGSASVAVRDADIATSVLDRARFTELYLERLRERAHPFSERDFLGIAEEGRLYGYVKNQFSDEAFDVLTEELPDPRVRYYKSFGDCAAALASGEVDHILLPLEERGGVRLPTVAELIYRYDFKINSVTPVFGLGGDADIKYAEISRRFRHSEGREGDDRYLELRVPASDGSQLSELLLAASALGMSAYRVNTHTIDFEGERVSYFSLVLRCGSAGISPMLTYLALFAEDFVPVGVYKNLE